MKEKLIKKVLPVVGGVIIVGFVLWQQSNKPEEGVKTPDGSTILGPNPQVQLEQANKIVWSLSNSDWPEKTKVYKTEKGDYLPVLNRLLEYVGLTEENKTSEDPQMVVYNREKDEVGLLVNKNLNIIGFDKTIKSKSELNNGVKLSENEIDSKFNELMSLLISNENIKTKITDKKYKEMVYPRWVDSSRDKADIVEVKAVYTVDGTEVKTFYNEPIVARFSMSGTLIKLDYVGLAKIMESQEVAVKNLNDLKDTKTEAFKVWKKEGNKQYDLEEDKNIGESVTVTNGELIQIQSDKGDKLWPHLLLEGNSISPQGPVKVYLIVQANK